MPWDAAFDNHLILLSVTFSHAQGPWACLKRAKLGHQCWQCFIALAVLHCARFNGDAVHFPFNASFFGQ
jgi:hypothetical protein